MSIKVLLLGVICDTSLGLKQNFSVYNSSLIFFFDFFFDNLRLGGFLITELDLVSVTEDRRRI